MTTSRETKELDFSLLRSLVDIVHAMPLADRTTLLKGLIPSIASELHPAEFEAFMEELRLKGERWYEAEANPGHGRHCRETPGERSIEGR